MNKYQQGFTLIEILVVLFIISITVSVAMLSINVNKNKKLESFTKQLTQNLLLIQEKAILEPAVIGMQLDQQHIFFSNYTDSKKWTVREDKFSSLHIPDGVFCQLTNVVGKDNSNPSIIFATNGEFTPFKMAIGWEGKKPKFIINGDMNGAIHYQSL